MASLQLVVFFVLVANTNHIKLTLTPLDNIVYFGCVVTRFYASLILKFCYLSWGRDTTPICVSLSDTSINANT